MLLCFACSISASGSIIAWCSTGTVAHVDCAQNRQFSEHCPPLTLTTAQRSKSSPPNVFRISSAATHSSSSGCSESTMASSFVILYPCTTFFCNSSAILMLSPVCLSYIFRNCEDTAQFVFFLHRSRYPLYLQLLILKQKQDLKTYLQILSLYYYLTTT